MPRQLTITPAPYKSSYLTIPPTPFSPRIPITPPATPQKDTRLATRAEPKYSTDILPPAEPLPWLWQCHKCKHLYQLGVTRRCLDDGHFFCAGTTVVKRRKKAGYKKVLRHQACASEFDYQGWKAWGTWRRADAERMEAAEGLSSMEGGLEGGLEEGKWVGGAWSNRPPMLKNTWEKPKKNCWDRCDYPSECQWGNRFGVSTPKMPVVIMPSIAVAKEEQDQPSPTAPETVELQPKTTFDDILGDIPIQDLDSADYSEPLSPNKSRTAMELTEREAKKPSMDDLLQFAKRRKRRSSGQIPSPLGGNPPSPALGKGKPEGKGADESEGSMSTTSVEMKRPVNGFEVDFRKGFGGVQEKADAFIKGFRVTKSKFGSGSS